MADRLRCADGRGKASLPLSGQDQEAWATYTRHVTPLPGRLKPEEPPVPPTEVTTGCPQPPTVTPGKRRPLPVLDAQPGGLDRGTWKRFQSGATLDEARLDLHGLTAKQAHAATLDFVAAAATRGLRCVEIITGQGRNESGGGVLRRELPYWLEDPALNCLILAASRNNPGSMRLLLRRRKPR
jgi:DNA-nicking Smr family endonuclease